MVLWMNSIGFSVRSFSRFHVEGLVTDEDGHFWNLLGLYGDPVASQRKLSWEFVRRLRPWPEAPWLVGGDLNEGTVLRVLSDAVRTLCKYGGRRTGGLFGII